VTHELLPSQAMSLGDLPIAGIVTETGGGTSHAAILARSRGIPAVSGVVGITGDVHSGDLMIVDGRDGVVLVRPDVETARTYRKMQSDFFDLKDRLVKNRDQPAASADGAQIELWPTSTPRPTPGPRRSSAPPASGCSGPSTCS
jgi:phosphotransferase system enzyme I (PtsI)